jgi:hypothetical protein
MGTKWWLVTETLKQRLYAPHIGGSISALQRETGISRGALNNAVTRAALPTRGNRWAPRLVLNEAGEIVQVEDVPEATPVADVTTRVREVDPPEMARMRQQVVRAQADAKQARAESKDLAKRANLVDEVRAILLPAAQAMQFERVPAPRPPKRTKRVTPVTMVSSWTDWHYGDIVDADEIMGENTYSPEIAVARVEHIIDTTRVFVEDGAHPVEEMVVVANGDLISNMHQLHPQSGNDGARAAKQGANVAMVFAQALVELAQIVPRIRVIAPARGGNHDRTTHRPSTGKASAESSWAAMIYELAAALCANQPNITWQVPTSYRAMFQVYGSTICAMHGDAMKGGGGNLGIPIYAIKRVYDAGVRRSASKARRSVIDDLTLDDALDQLRGIVRHVFVGHFHTDVQAQFGDGYACIDPSLKGPDTFSVDVLERESPAAQKLRVFHPEHDLIGTHTIKCGHVTTNPTRYKVGALEGEGMAVELLAEG